MRYFPILYNSVIIFDKLINLFYQFKNSISSALNEEVADLNMLNPILCKFLEEKEK